nr:metallophosphoesterase [Candidatus Sigynarchaeota archaeon]
MDRQVHRLDDFSPMQKVQIVSIIDKRKVLRLLSDATEVAKSFPRLIELELLPDESITIVGDTHGDIDMLKKIIGQFLPDSFNQRGERLLFLGDYVDRNEHDIENINYLLKLMAEVPSRLMMLRGNHEEHYCNLNYGFYDNLVNAGLDEYYSMYEGVFRLLPVACVIRNLHVFCCHGMVPELRGAVMLAEIANVPRASRSEEWDPITTQLLWNDPSQEEAEFSEPSIRGIGIEMGKRDLDDFLKANGLKLVIRSHQAFPEGFKLLLGGKVLSIFSTPNYGMAQNDATIARLHGDGRVDILKAGIDDKEFSIVETMKLS